MKGEITFLGYRFEVRSVERDGRSFISFIALDPETPQDVAAALYQTANQNVACLRKNLAAVATSLPASVPSPSEPTTL